MSVQVEIDKEGDRWVLCDDGRFECIRTGTHSREKIVERWGPLKPAPDSKPQHVTLSPETIDKLAAAILEKFLDTPIQPFGRQS